MNMKRTITLCIAFLGLSLCSVADPVDLQTAQSIAIKFMATNNLQLTATYQTDKNAAAFYVFITTDGFVIVSADDCETPIIGYSREGCFDPDNIPVQMEDYLQDFVVRLQYGIENHVVADAVTTRQWELVKATGRLNERKDTQAVGPLLTEKWHQGCLYNSLCPEMDGPCDHAEVGCVAVAMGQIMHYWGYPASGWGSNAYYNFGVQLSANFGNTSYDWEHMPDSLTDTSSEEEISAVATLLYHCGVAVNMAYNENGSNASSAKVPDALKRYFDFSRQLHRDKKGNDNAAWLDKLKACLDLQRPIYYSGQGSAGGHAFVCDGYDADDLLHFNWGWGGNGDGYFALGNLNVIGYHFNNNNYAILDIFPQYEPCVVNATAYPATAGSIEGTGEYHLGEQCVLTAIPAENCEFKYWKDGDRIATFEESITVDVEGDINDLVAYFTHRSIKHLTAHYAPDTSDINSPHANLTWTHDDNEWVLLKQFEIGEWESTISTDNEYIYTCRDSIIFLDPTSVTQMSIVQKYSMDGDFMEQFEMPGKICTSSMVFDGNFFYCNSTISLRNLYCVNLANNELIDSTRVEFFTSFEVLAYDETKDGFWLINHHYPAQIALMDRQGQGIQNGPSTSLSFFGAKAITAKDGSPHLLLCCGSVLDYDINLNSINEHPLMGIGSVYGASFGKYNGKDALFVIVRNNGNYTNIVRIYEIKNNLAQIVNYRLYRADSQGNIVMLAYEVTGTSFIDHSWDNIAAGEYRFGISEVYSNGDESEIIWSNTLVKPTDGIEENNCGQEAPEPSVRKVIEDGHIIIIKDGKRYNISGQQLN